MRTPARGTGEPRAEPPAAREALGSAFFDRPAERVARDLLGHVLVSECDEGRTAGRIVETEAYPGPEDPASHAAASIGRTRRNEPMFGPPGSAYIHLNYGVHWCLNVVTGVEGHPAAVLIRALEPVEGRALMLDRRARPELTSGPGRLTQALGIGPSLQGHPLDRAPVWLAPGRAVPDEAVRRTPRIGISKAADRPLRFVDSRSRWISRTLPR